MTISRNQRIEAIFDNFHAIRRTYADSTRFSSRHFGVTMTQASVLMMLFHQGRHTMSQLAAAIGVSKSAASQLLDGLIEQQFVTRTQDEHDRRIAYVELSESGKTQLEHVWGSGTGNVTEIFDVLDDQEIMQIEVITTKLANARSKGGQESI